MFSLDPSDPTPLYAQLERAIRASVSTGRLPSGAQLPTVRQLAVDLRINANTVAKVYAALERSGLLESRRGVGTFVKAAHHGGMPRAERLARLDELADRYLSGARSLGFGAAEALGRLADRLGTQASSTTKEDSDA
ncbi:MAG: GntR family transcriptional regulator [Isosphaeraceae bacterium]